MKTKAKKSDRRRRPNCQRLLLKIPERIEVKGSKGFRNLLICMMEDWRLYAGETVMLAIIGERIWSEGFCRLSWADVVKISGEFPTPDYILDGMNRLTARQMIRQTPIDPIESFIDGDPYGNSYNVNDDIERYWDWSKRSEQVTYEIEILNDSLCALLRAKP